MDLRNPDRQLNDVHSKLAYYREPVSNEELVLERQSE